MKSSDEEEEAVGKAAVEAVTYIEYLDEGLRDRDLEAYPSSRAALPTSGT